MVSIGPIIRINPDELHCNDPKMIDSIYAIGNKKRDKSPHFVAAFPSKYACSYVFNHPITYVPY